MTILSISNLVQGMSGVPALDQRRFSKNLSLRSLPAFAAPETTELKNLRLAGKSKQSFLFELFDDAVVDQIFSFEGAEFFIGESQYPDAVADTFSGSPEK